MKTNYKHENFIQQILQLPEKNQLTFFITSCNSNVITSAINLTISATIPNNI